MYNLFSFICMGLYICLFALVTYWKDQTKKEKETNSQIVFQLYLVLVTNE